MPPNFIAGLLTAAIGVLMLLKDDRFKSNNSANLRWWFYPGWYNRSVSDAWLIKTDANGSEQWNKTFGGYYWETAYSVQQTQDGGYIFRGHSLYFGSEGDAFLIKTDAIGNLLWSKMFGNKYLIL